MARTSSMSCRYCEGVSACALSESASSGLVVDFHHESVCAGCHAGSCERRDHICRAGAVRRINDHRQMRNSPDRRHRSKIERVPRMLRERANTAFAEDHVVIALSHDVFRCEQPFLERCSHSAFQQHRQPGSASALQKRKVLHVASADLDYVAILSIRST